MTERWVLNASPIIVLCRIGTESLLTLADEVVVPQAVVDEIRVGQEDDPARIYLDRGSLPIAPNLPISSQLSAQDLGRGETAVLAYAMTNPGWTAILDDRAARRYAAQLSIAVKGTLGIILLARKRQMIPSAGAVLRELCAVGFRLDDQIVAAALRQTVGEEWP